MHSLTDKSQLREPKTPFYVFERKTNSTIARLVNIKSVTFDLDTGT